MKFDVKILILILLLNIAVFTGCGEDDEDPKYSFKVISSNGPFEGYYFLNGEDFESFNSTADAGSTVFHVYEKSISSIDSIIIYATGLGPEATGISIYLYSDKTLLKREDVSQVDDTATISLTLEYSASAEEE